METKRNSQLLLPLILLSVLFSQSWALPASEAEALSFRNVRHADGVFTTNISSLLDDHSPEDYPASFIEKRESEDISEDLEPSNHDGDTSITACLASITKFLREDHDSKKRNARRQKDDSKNLIGTKPMTSFQWYKTEDTHAPHIMRELAFLRRSSHAALIDLRIPKKNH